MLSSTTPPDEKTELLQSKNDEKLQNAKNNNKGPFITAAVFFMILAVFLVSVYYCSNDTRNDDTNDLLSQTRSSNIQKNNDPSCEFPSDFVWGSATSSYQVEGAVKEDGRGTTIWDTYVEVPGRILNQDTGDVACDHYHLYEKDVQLMKELGLQAYRFSIAWSRIIPSPTGHNDDATKINMAGIKFYNQLIDTLLAHDIEPWVTLYHWDLPQSLEDIGTGNGWLNERANQTVEAFGIYARIYYIHFGDRVKKWITINEPWTVAIHGYNDGLKAPGFTILPGEINTEAYIVGHNLLLAHAKAATIYKQEFQSIQGGIIGLAANSDYRYPKNPSSQKDIDAANRSILFHLGWFVDPIMKHGDYPQVMRQQLGDRLPKFTKEQKAQLFGSCDFLGLNTYSSALASDPTTTSESLLRPGYWTDANVILSNDPNWKQNFMGWNIVPQGTRDLLLWIDQRYNKPVIYITENGSAEDEPNHLVKNINDGTSMMLHDEVRRSFFEGNLRACAQAINAGVNLKGYFAWSFMDNFEWEYGYQRRFGMCHVDFDTQVRTPKLSARWYSETIQENGKNIIIMKD